MAWACRAIFAIARNFNPAKPRNYRYGYLSKSVCYGVGWYGMEIGRGPIAGFGGALAERSSGYWVARSNGRSLRVFYGSSLRHLCFNYCDPGEPFVCCRDLRSGSLLRNFLDTALVASEDLRVARVAVETSH